MANDKQYMVAIGTIIKDLDIKYGKSGAAYIPTSMKLINTVNEFVNVTVFPDKDNPDESVKKLEEIVKKGNVVIVDGEYQITEKDGLTYKSIAVNHAKIKSLLNDMPF